MSQFKNPILPGFYPDPSLCRVGHDYYLVTSSFAYFPGIPIFQSRDLVHWQQLGHVLTRPGQLPLAGLGHSQGIFAPTIRCDQGVFYVITTNVGGGGNFVVTATDPKGPWTDPYWLKDAPGIDPSLYFASDGRAYFCGTRPNPQGERYNGDYEIYLQEFDRESMSLKGEAAALWKGALKGAIWPEAPHIYKRGQYYYLLISEGGTGYHHAITVARSTSIDGPYEGNPANPILTHRHLGRDYPIVNPGHGDLVQTSSGEWWIVFLASRPQGGYYRNLGRETFLAPVIWEDDWPIISPQTGKIKLSYPKPNLPQATVQPWPQRDDFENEELGFAWNFLRTPVLKFWDLKSRPGYLRLFLQALRINDIASPSFVGRRQQHHNFLARTALEFSPQASSEGAGLIAMQNGGHFFLLEVAKKGGQRILRLVQGAAGQERELAREVIAQGRIYLKIEGRGQNYSFFYGQAEGEEKPLFKGADGRILSSERAGGFVGTYLGLYATSNGKKSNNYADYDWFDYSEL